MKSRCEWVKQINKWVFKRITNLSIKVCYSIILTKEMIPRPNSKRNLIRIKKPLKANEEITDPVQHFSFNTWSSKIQLTDEIYIRTRMFGAARALQQSHFNCSIRDPLLFRKGLLIRGLERNAVYEFSERIKPFEKRVPQGKSKLPSLENPRSFVSQRFLLNRMDYEDFCNFVLKI